MVDPANVSDAALSPAGSSRNWLVGVRRHGCDQCFLLSGCRFAPCFLCAAFSGIVARLLVFAWLVGSASFLRFPSPVLLIRLAHSAVLKLSLARFGSAPLAVGPFGGVALERQYLSNSSAPSGGGRGFCLRRLHELPLVVCRIR